MAHRGPILAPKHRSRKFLHPKSNRGLKRKHKVQITPQHARPTLFRKVCGLVKLNSEEVALSWIEFGRLKISIFIALPALYHQIPCQKLPRPKVMKDPKWLAARNRGWSFIKAESPLINASHFSPNSLPRKGLLHELAPPLAHFC